MKVENISRFKKDRFLKSLTEDEFRDRAVRPLMLRSGYKDGRDLCGPNEHGKDALFSSIDQLGISTIIAVQTKRGNLNLAGTTQRNLVDVITQLKTSLETSLVLVATRQKCRPNRVILAASGRINDAARHHIVDSVQSPNSTFWDSDDLVPMIDEHLPELWLGIETDMLPYFNAIERMVIGKQGGHSGDGHDAVLLGAADDQSFVALSLHWVTTKKRKVHGQYHETPHFEELPLASIINHKTRRALILGEGGSGKSTGLKRIALELARRALEEDSKLRIPILMKAVDISRTKPTTLVNYADDITRALSGSRKACFTDKDLSAGRVILLIDGLDEVASDTERSSILNLIEVFLTDNQACQAIVTARPYRFVSELSGLKQYEEFRISPINWKQAEKIVTKITESRKVPRAQSQEFLRRLEKIHGFELNPLLVTVFAATTDYTKQDIPANITELFKKFTELMLGRWDERKGLRQQYQAPLKDFVLTRLAFHMHSSRMASIARPDAIEIVRNELVRRGHTEDIPKLLDEIFDRSGIFRVMGNEIEFRHHLLQEFFAGRGIADPDTVPQLIHDDWWKRALIFYFGERADSISLLASSAKAAQGMEPGQLLEAATTVGLALQACYLSPVGEKLELWRWVVEALEISQAPAIKAFDADGKYPISTFFHFYLYARDSVSLSHLRANLEELKGWANATTLVKEDSSRHQMYWLIVGLIEAGDVSVAEDLIHDFHPADPRLLVAVHLGCHLANEIRPLPEKERAAARRICAALSNKVAPFVVQIRNEFGSALLEMRKGKVESLDDESGKLIPG